MKENKWTTLSVEKELKPLLDNVMLKMQEKLTYNEIVKRLATEYLKK
jgi:hypothetical protein